MKRFVRHSSIIKRAEEFKPFYAIKRLADGCYLTRDGQWYSKQIDNYKFNSKEEAQKLLQKMKRQFPDIRDWDNDCEIITINDQKENYEFRKKIVKVNFLWPADEPIEDYI